MLLPIALLALLSLGAQSAKLAEQADAAAIDCPPAKGENQVVTVIRGTCYKADAKSYTSFQAEDACDKEGGRLASIKDAATNAALTAWLQAEIKKDIKKPIREDHYTFWIGLTAGPFPSLYKWADGSTLEDDDAYRNFKTDLYERYGLSGVCVRLDAYDGQWARDKCLRPYSEGKAGVICEYEPDQQRP